MADELADELADESKVKSCVSTVIVRVNGRFAGVAHVLTSSACIFLFLHHSSNDLVLRVTVHRAPQIGTGRGGGGHGRGGDRLQF